MKQKIEWEVGKPTNDGLYLITQTDGTINTSFYSNFGGWEYPNVKAWFPTKNFEPYKN